MSLKDAELLQATKATHYDLLANSIQTKQSTTVCSAPRDTECSDIKHQSCGLKEKDGNLIKS